MKTLGQKIGLGIAILLFLAIVPYSVIEWFDDRIPYSPDLYLFSAISIILLVYNIYNYRREN